MATSPKLRYFLLIPMLFYFLFLFWFHWIQPKTPSKAEKIAANNEAIAAYVERFHPLAIAEMQRLGVPASITLAQGILESQYGKSELAQQANNHFGMKCGGNWEGDSYSKFTGEWNNEAQSYRQLACFRVFDSAEASFRAHSDFLRYRKYYQKLFLLPSKDYKAWAKGLQAAGYATDPKYPDKLISLIERFELDQYDQLLLRPESPWVLAPDTLSFD
ncbi:muramidase (flagellum-specific) [Saprospira grandis DSM 2844]|uniref:Muramidase (Flagellum-specific) n=1 Tax=Saprospira grandis DSM 2844 TaxID=694433 RepID=J0NYF2_9BACT|nr:glucosaminidase domain-containing protein [Saprospira grandis]EJF52544.1 muramidase (flagellum-specific) [Saprospira grandis DSM 2844]